MNRAVSMAMIIEIQVTKLIT